MATKTVTERNVLYGGTVVIDYYPNSHRYKLVELDGVEKKEWLKSPSKIVDMLDKSGPLIGWAVNCFHDRFIEEMRDGVNFSKDDVLAMLEVSKNAHAEKKQVAADVGTIVHEYAQHHNKPEIKSVADIEGFEDLSDDDKRKARNGQDAFDKWYAQLGGVSVESEFMIYSKRHGFVGRCDDLVEIGGKYYIIDYKTSKGVYTSQVYQVTGYMKAREEEYGIRIEGAILLHLIKDDIEDKDGNIVKEAGDFGEVHLSRSELVQAYKVFKALKVVADVDPLFTKKLRSY